MKYEITIPYEKLNNTIEDDMHKLLSLGVTDATHIILDGWPIHREFLDGWEIECTPEVLMMVLLTIEGSSVVSTL